MTDRYLYFRSAAARRAPISCTPPFGSDVCAGRSHMAYSLACALRTALATDRKLVIPDRFCCHPLHCGHKRCEPTRNFFSLQGGNVILESEASARTPITVPCTQNLTTWSDAAVLQRPRECTKYWFQACANFTKTPMYQIWMPWTAPENTTRWIQTASTEFRQQAAEANATITCVHLRRTDKMGRDYPCSKRDLTPNNIFRTLRTHYPDLQWLYVATDENDAAYLQTLRTVLSADYTVFFRSDLPLLSKIVGPHADVLADYGVCAKFPTIESREGREKKYDMTHYLTTDLKNGCLKDKQRQCPRYQCTSPGQWSRP